MIDYIYDRDGNLINDPERTKIVGGRWNSLWPKGYGTFNGIVHRNILDQWAVKMAYRLVRRDGQRTVYDGRLQAPELRRSGGRDQATVTAQGWYALLAERTIRKRWYDKAAVDHFRWPSGVTGENQTAPVVEKRDKDQLIRISIRPDDYNLTTADYYQEQWIAPSGLIYAVSYDYDFRTNEGFDVVLWNDDDASAENAKNMASAVIDSGSVSQVFAEDTVSFTIRVGPDGSSSYDQNDWVALKNIIVKCTLDSNHSNTGVPAYSMDELIEDVLLLARGSEISADMSQISGDSSGLDSFISENGGFETADSLVQRLAAYSDSSQRTYGLQILGGDGSSDGLPQAHFGYRDVSDYDFEVHIDDCDTFEVSQSERELYNSIRVKWEDESGHILYLTADDDADLMDQTSIDRYGERHNPKVLDAGQASQSQAKQMAERELAYHKDPLWKGNFSKKWTIRTKGGVEVPISWVTAGSRVRIPDLKETLFIRECDYDSDSGVMMFTPDLPADYL